MNFLFLLVSGTGTVGWTERWVQSVRSLYGDRPLAASMEVKNDYAHVTLMSLYKFIYVKKQVMNWIRDILTRKNETL